MRISRRIGLAAMAIALLVPSASASAASTVSASPAAITFAGGAENSDISLSWDSAADAFLFTEADPTAAPLAAEAPCTAVGASTVSCPAPAVTGITLDLGAGNDRFSSALVAPAPTPVVTVNGGDGADLFRSPVMDGVTAFDGQAGRDSLSYELRTAGVVVDLALGTAGELGEGDTVAHVEQVTGGVGGSELTGGAGDDVLIGQGGTDKISGGEGADLIVPGTGDDDVDGGPGADTVSYQDTVAGVSVSLAAGTAGATGSSEADALKNFENVIGSDGGDLIEGDDGDNVIAGLIGSDDIRGGGGTDTAGYAERTQAVTINLPAGTGEGPGGEFDFFQGVENALGGSGDDMIRMRDNAVASADCGAGSDTVYGDVSGQLGSTVSDVLTGCELVNPDHVPPVNQPAEATTTTPGAQAGSPSGQAEQRGAKACKVPNLKGRTLAGARAMLKKAGCRTGRVMRKRAKGRRGRVVRFKPGAGRTVRAGTRIALVLAR